METLIQPSRRGFLTGLAGLVAAPALVKATSLMPIKPWDDREAFLLRFEAEALAAYRQHQFLVDAAFIRSFDDLIFSMETPGARNLMVLP